MDFPDAPDGESGNLPLAGEQGGLRLAFYFGQGHQDFPTKDTPCRRHIGIPIPTNKPQRGVGLLFTSNAERLADVRADLPALVSDINLRFCKNPG